MPGGEQLVFDSKLRSTYVCSAHQIPIKVWESDLNRGVARLGSHPDPSVRRATIQAIWPDVNVTCCGEIAQVTESGFDADWILSCRTCGDVIALAEHKPFGAPKQWSVAEIAAYRGPGLLDAPQWVIDFPLECEGTHSPHTHGGAHPGLIVRNSNPPVTQLRAPQVLVYSHKHGDKPVTIVQYENIPASELYGTTTVRADIDFRLNEELFPVRTTDQFLESLAQALDEVPLDDETNSFARNLMGALWYRSAATLIDKPALEHARNWIPTNYPECASASEHPLNKWSDRVSTP